MTKIKAVLNLLVSFVIIGFIVSCKGDINKSNVIENDIKRSYSNIVDSLLLSNISTDSTNYLSYFDDDTYAFISGLISKIDSKKKRAYLSPFKTPLNVSTLPTYRGYVGGRAVCYLEFLLSNASTEYKQNSTASKFCSVCIFQLLNINDRPVSFNQLILIKTIFQEWNLATKDFCFTKRKKIWLTDYEKYIRLIVK